MTRIRMGLVLGLLLALALAVAACGGDKTGGVASLGGADTATATTGGTTDPRQAGLAFARCMRQHGIDMPDPKVDANGRTDQQLPQGVGPDDPKFQAAQQACRHYLPNAGEPEKPNPQEQQQMLAFARCMRQHGVNMPDPKPNGGIDVNGETGVNPDSPKFKAAQQACQQYEPKSGEKQTQRNGGGT